MGMVWQGKPSVSFLQEIPLFSDLPLDALAALVKRTRTIKLTARQFLFHKGDKGDALYVLAQGQIQIGVVAPDGRQVSFAQIHAGQMFGEIAVFDNGPRTADALAVTDSVLLSLGQKDILAYMTEYPAHAMHLIGTLCQRIRNADQLIEDFMFLSLPARVAKHLRGLCDASPKTGARIILRISQQDLADQMSVSRESINRLLSKWELANVVSLSRGQISILDRSQLELFLAP